MSYEVRFLPEAQKDFSQLDGSQKQQGLSLFTVGNA